MWLCVREEGHRGQQDKMREVGVFLAKLVFKRNFPSMCLLCVGVCDVDPGREEGGNQLDVIVSFNDQ